MTTLAHPLSSPPVDSVLRRELHFVLQGLARRLADKLSSLVDAKLAGKKISTKAVERVVIAHVPGLLEEEFMGELLASKGAAQRRAMLAHVLSTIEVRSMGVSGETSPAAAELETDDDVELTSEAAAKLLHVSRSHLNSLADSGALGEVRRTAGNHRRISKAALVDYKARSKERQARGLDEMVEASRNLGLYGEELAGIPRRSRR
jgi:excisionase family DNA binding protein